MKGREKGWDPVLITRDHQAAEQLNDEEYLVKLSRRLRELHDRLTKNVLPLMSEVEPRDGLVPMKATPWFDYEHEKYKSSPASLRIVANVWDTSEVDFTLEMKGVRFPLLELTHGRTHHSEELILECDDGRVGDIGVANYFEVICSNWEKEEKKKAEAALAAVNEAPTGVDTPVVSEVK